MIDRTKYVLQLCHCYNMPFLDVARQYASLFKGSDYHLVTVYLTGIASDEVIQQTASDTVLFLENTSKDLKGLKHKQIKQIKQLCQQYDFEFAIGHRYKAIYTLCHIKNLPVIGVLHAFSVYDRFMRRFFTMRHQQNLLLLGVSNAIRDDIKKYLPKFPDQQIQTLYNRINVRQIQENQLDKATARKQLAVPNDKYVFANVGRLHPDKDHQTLIKAYSKVANKLPDSILVLIGKGRLEKELKLLVKQLKLEEQVIFLGVVPDAVNYFQAFDSFVLSSDFEPFGMVLLEAIIAELPIIASNAGGAKEIIQDEQWLFDVGNENQLANLMLEIYALDEKQKQNIHEQNMEHLKQNFTDEAVKNTFWSLPIVSTFNNN